MVKGKKLLQNLQRFELSEKNIIDDSMHVMFGFINEDYRPISQVNFNDWMYPQASKFGMQQKDFLRGTSDFFQDNVFTRGTSHSFSNSDFHIVLNNVEDFLKRKFPDDDSGSLLTKMSLNANGIQDFILANVLPKISSGSVNKLSHYAAAYASKTTGIRQTQSWIEAEDEETNSYDQVLEYTSLPGAYFQKNAFLWNAGRTLKVKVDSKTRILDMDPELKFNFLEGSGTIKVNAKRKKDEVLAYSWDDVYNNLGFLSRRIASGVHNAGVINSSRKNIITELYTMISTYNKCNLHSLEADKTTYHHNISVAGLSLFLGKLLGFPQREMAALAYAALKHDFAKTLMPQSILRSKERPLPAEAFRVIQEHTLMGTYTDLKNMLPLLDSYFSSKKKKEIDDLFHKGFSENLEKKIRFAVVDGAMLMDLHQEFFNGKGYGLGLRGNEISLAGHLIKPIDDHDALERSRSYKPEYSSEEVLRITRENLFAEHYHPLIGKFVCDTMSNLYLSGYNHSQYSVCSDSLLSKMFSGYLRGNLKLDIPITVSEELKTLIENYQSPIYQPEQIFTTIEKKYVGFFDEIRLNELARKFVTQYESQSISQLKNNELTYNHIISLENNNTYDVFQLSPNDIKVLEENVTFLRDSNLNSQRYISDLVESMPSDLLPFAKMSYTENNVWKNNNIKNLESRLSLVK